MGGADPPPAMSNPLEMGSKVCLTDVEALEVPFSLEPDVTYPRKCGIELCGFVTTSDDV
tara:strand:+ start:634 stop:810 length:177 start_codon:yes stop_codon:yes gene_type:complete